jgi:hypothetical protein
MLDRIALITGNTGQAAEYAAMLGIDVNPAKAELTEVQSLDVAVVAARKTADAYAQPPHLRPDDQRGKEQDLPPPPRSRSDAHGTGTSLTTSSRAGARGLGQPVGQAAALSARSGRDPVRTLRPRADVPAVRDFTAELRERLPAAAGHSAPR